MQLKRDTASANKELERKDAVKRPSTISSLSIRVFFLESTKQQAKSH